MNFTPQNTPKNSFEPIEDDNSPFYRPINKRIKELPLSECCVNENISIIEVAALFEQNQDWPGVILLKNDQYVGMVSRNRCFEILSKPFIKEVFSKRTSFEFYKTFETYDLILDSNTTIQEAVKLALNRDRTLLFEPVIVTFESNIFRLLNMQNLLMGQSDLLENLFSEVQQLSILDPLTNLNNRRGFFGFAQWMVRDMIQNSNELSAIMVDIDRFKRINDHYGHFAGDRVLRSIAEEIQATLRKNDLLGRFGGEEFIALLPNTTSEIAFGIAERLRNRIENKVTLVNDKKIKVTVSIGISEFKEANKLLDTLLTHADQAMYWAKNTGRNRVMIWNQLIPSTLAKNYTRNESKASHIFANHYSSIVDIDSNGVFEQTIQGWVKALEMRDNGLEGHAERVVNMTNTLAGRVGFNEIEQIRIRRGAILHDIGKLAIPDSILFKPDPLTDAEWEIMKKHPVYGFEFLSPIAFLQKSIDIPYCHHEHWDGSGYPQGLKGEEIPLAARVFSIVDVWDALSSKRCYRPAWDSLEVEQYIGDQSGKLFDPGITPIFLKLLKELPLSTELPSFV